MKRLLGIFLMFVLALSFGCQKKKEQTPPVPKTGETKGSIMQPVEDYASGLKSNLDKAKGAQTKADVDELQRAVNNYQMENGRYPDSLDAIKPYIRAGIDTGKFDYIPSSGSVSIK